MFVNELRKQTAQTWPDVSKRCRNLIKSWQKIAEVNRPTSSCGNSSNGGTPNIKFCQPDVSPALSNGGGNSVVSARKNVQSTAELIAQLVSENLPNSISVNLPGASLN